MRDLRPQLFSGMCWYDSLEPPLAGERSAWFQFKAPMDADEVFTCRPSRELLNDVLQYTQLRCVWEHYDQRLHGVSAKSLTPEEADSQGKSVTAPLWEVLNEPFAALFLERVLGWSYIEHEPPGKDRRRGDWMMATESGDTVFVEVKTTSEAPRGAGAFDYESQVWNAVDGAHRQVSRATATLVVVCDDVGVDFSDIADQDELFSPFVKVLFGEEVIAIPVGPGVEQDAITFPFRPRARWFGSLLHVGAVMHLGRQIRELGTIDARCRVYPNPAAQQHARILASDFGNMKTVQVELDDDQAHLRVANSVDTIRWPGHRV